MISPDLMLAVILLTAAPESPEPAPMSEPLQAMLRTVAIEWEILDARESPFFLARPADVAADLNVLRRRFRELADAPPLSDSCRFPDRATINQFLSFNRAYRQHLGQRQPLTSSRWWDMQDVIQETEHLYQVWSAAGEARCENSYVVVRRQALKKLLQLAGPAAYYSGRLPPCVPLWRFQTID